MTGSLIASALAGSDPGAEPGDAAFEQPSGRH